MNLKDQFISFFISKDHKQIPSAPIIPENDPTCLFNTAGMQPLVPYLMGEIHPLGTKLVDYQKCVRLTDLEEVGDTTHHTFFEMLGNWSLGDYFKKESITWSFEFLTQVLKIPVSKLAVTVFKGNTVMEVDQESASIWESLGIPKERIAFLEDNWWGPAGVTGPCGPDTEIFYFRSTDEVPSVYDPNDERWVEIWNNVFMEYYKDVDGKFTLLDKKNVDTGMGLERVVAILEGVDDNYLSSVWKPIISKIEQLSGFSYQNSSYTKAMRIIADHIRTAVFISADEAGIRPSNTDQGYILRRLIRRAIRYAKMVNMDIMSDWERDIALTVIEQYSPYYQELADNKETVLEILHTEKVKFSRTLEKGLHEFEKIVSSISDSVLNKDLAFKLYDTYGFPIEDTIELATERNLCVDVEGFREKFKEHQEKSRAGAEQKFKGGLASTGIMETRYHTATHLLNAVLKQVLGDHVHQKGSNITEARMRFDFSHDQKMTSDEIALTERLMNQYIEAGLEVAVCEMSKEEAIASGAEAMFLSKYGDIVKVYSIGDVSKEVCGGPHVSNTKELGHFHIVKEEASSAGVRRIKAVLE